MEFKIIEMKVLKKTFTFLELSSYFFEFKKIFLLIKKYPEKTLLSSIFTSHLIFMSSCIPAGPGGSSDIEIETSQRTDNELVDLPASNLEWNNSSIEFGVSYADRALASWTPSADAPFYATQQIQLYSGPNCDSVMGGWRDVPVGKNEFWAQNLSHLSSVSYRIKTRSKVNDKVSACSSSISVDLNSPKAPVITSSCPTSITQNESYSCQVTYEDLNLHASTFSLNANTCGVGLTIDTTTGLISWVTNDDDFSAPTCSTQVIITDPDSETDSQIITFALNNLTPVLTIAAQAIIENSATAIILTDAEVQASDEGYGVYSLDDGSVTGTACSTLGTYPGGINSTTGELAFLPTAHQAGTCKIGIQFDDQNSVSNIVFTEVTLVITSTNSLPTISENCPTNLDEDQVFACSISSTDSDAIDTLTYALSSANTCSWVSVNPVNGVISTSASSPHNSNVGICILGVQVSDGEAVVKTQKIITINNVLPTLTITNVNSLGNITPYSDITIKADGDVEASDEPYGVYSLVTSDSVPDCSLYSQSLSIDSTEGTINIKPLDSFASGGCFIKVSFNDGNSLPVTSQFLFNLNTTNSAPDIVERIAGSCVSAVNQGHQYTCELEIDTLSNIDGDAITWSLDEPTHTCDWITSVDANGDISVNTHDDMVGTCVLSVKATDTPGDTDVFTKTVSINNLTPTLNINTNINLNEDAPEQTLFTSAQMQASDEPYGTYSILTPGPENCGDNGTLTLNAANGELKFLVDANYSNDCTIVIRFDDGNGAHVDETVNITFNEVPDAPTLSESCAVSVDEDVTYSCALTVDDPDFNEEYTWQELGATTGTDCSWLDVDTNGVISGTPNDDQVGTCQYRVSVKDKFNLESNIITLDLTITNVLPTIPALSSAPSVGTFNEDSGVLILKSDLDVESIDENYGVYALNPTTVGSPSCNDFGEVSIDPLTGSILFLPTANWSGQCYVRVEFDDQNSVQNVSASEFDVTITEVPDLPTINTSHCNDVIVQGKPADIAAGNLFFCTPQLADLDPSPPSTVSLNIVSNDCPEIFEQTGDAIQNKTGRPNDDDVGNCKIIVEAVDNTGSKSQKNTLDIYINNQIPTILVPKNPNNISITEDPGSAVTILTAADVSSSDEGYGSYSLLAGVSAPSCISVFQTLSIQAETGELTGEPAADFFGECFVTIVFNDNNSPNGVSEKEIRVQVLPDADSPIISNDCSLTIGQNQAYTCQFSYTDKEDFENKIFQFAGDNTCGWARIDAENGNITGTPQNVNLSGGSCLLSVEVDDGRSLPISNQAITITFTNVAPIFGFSLTDVTILEDSSDNVIHSDSAVAVDEEGSGTYSLAAATATDCQSVASSISIDGTNGEILYSPQTDYAGDCNIKVSFDDGNGSIVSDEFTVTVTPVSDPLAVTATCDTTATEQSAYTTCNPAVTDPDATGNITWALAKGNTCSWLTINAATGATSGTPDDNDVGTCQLSMQASTEERYSNIVNTTITVDNIQPSFTGLTIPNVPDNSINMLVRDVNVDNAQEGHGIYKLSSTTVGNPNCLDHNVVYIDPETGEIYFTPIAGYTTPCFIKVEFDDQNPTDNIGSSEVSVNITVADGPPVLGDINACASSATEDTPFNCQIAATDNATVTIGGGSPTHQLITTSDHTCGAITHPTSLDDTLDFQFTPNNIHSNNRFCMLNFYIEEIASSKKSVTVNKLLTITNNVPTFTAEPNDLSLPESDGTYTVFSDAEVQTGDETDDFNDLNSGTPTISSYNGSYSITEFGANLCSNVGIVNINANNGLTTFTPSDESFTGDCNISIRYNDGNALNNAVQKQITLTITEQVDPPVVTATCSTTATEGSLYTCLPEKVDPDAGESYTWSLTNDNGKCGWLKVDPLSGNASGTPEDANADGVPCRFKFTVNDGTSSTASSEVAITVINQVPTLSISNVVVPNEFTVSSPDGPNPNFDGIIVLGDLDVQASDESATTTYTLSPTILDSTTGLACNLTDADFDISTSTGRLALNNGTYTEEDCLLTIEFTDLNGGIASETFEISINGTAPIPTIDTACTDATITQNNALGSCAGVHVLGNTNSDTFEYRKDTALSTCDFLSIDASTGDITGTPDNNDILGDVGDSNFAECLFIYYAENVGAASHRRTNKNAIIYTITNVDPTFTPIPSATATINEDAGMQTIFTNANIITDEESVSSKGKYTVIAASANDCNDNGDTSINQQRGTLQFEPAQDFNTDAAGPCNIKVQFDDENGSQIEHEVAITVNSINDSPSFSENCAPTTPLSSAFSCQLGLSETDGDTITWSTRGGHTCSWMSVDVNGLLTGTPTLPGDVGVCTIDIGIHDGVPDATNDFNAQFTITVEDVSPAITITSVATLAEDDPNTEVIANGDITNAEEGGGGSYALNNTNAQLPKCSDNGVLTLNNATTGSISFHPAQDYNGTCFAHIEFDNTTSTTPSSIDFGITVTPVNDPPQITTACDRTVQEGDAFICHLRAINPETEEQIVWSVDNDCGWAKLHKSGAIYGVPKQENVGTCKVAVTLGDDATTVSEEILIVVENRTPTLNILDQSIVFTDGTQVIVSDSEVQASEESVIGSSYRLAHEITPSPRCYDLADSISIDDRGEISADFSQYDYENCFITVEFTDSITAVNDTFEVNFLNTLNKPSLNAACPISTYEGSDYFCRAYSKAFDNKEVTYTMHSSSSCDWLTINSQSGAITGKTNNSHVGNCRLAFYSESPTLRSEIYYTNISISNVAPDFDLPSIIATKKVKINSTGEKIFDDFDIQVNAEDFGFYFLDANVISQTDCRANGEVVLEQASGGVTFAPKRFFGGNCNFNLNYFDLHSEANTVTKNVQILVEGTNNRPALNAACSSTATIDSLYTCTVIINDNDLTDTTTLSIDSNRHTCSWASIDIKSIIGTPATSDTGQCLISILASDGKNESHRYEELITINNVSGEFTLPTSKALAEDAAFQIILTDTEVDFTKESQGGFYFLSHATSGDPEDDCRAQGNYSIDKNNGEIQFSPSLNYNGECSFFIGFDDLSPTNNITLASVSLTVNSVDDEPSISANCSLNATQDLLYSCNIHTTDPDSITAALYSKTDRDTCSWLNIDSTTGVLSGTPVNSNVGECIASVITTVDSLASAPYEVTINTSDIASSFSLADKVITEDRAAGILYTDAEVYASEESHGSYYLNDNVTIGTACSSYGTLSLNSTTGEVSFAANSNINGECYIRIGFQESNFTSSRVEAQAKLTITPTNDAPSLNYQCNSVVSQDTPFECFPEFYDPDGDAPYSYTQSNNTCTWLTLNSETGKLSGTPNNSHIGTCGVTLKSSDGEFFTNEHTVQINIVNRVPKLLITDTIIQKNSILTILKSDYDVQSTEEGFGVYQFITTSNSPLCSQKGNISINNNNGEITFAPQANFVGKCFVNVQFNDGSGGIANSEFTVTINDVNTKPTVDHLCSTSLTEKSLYTCSLAVSDPDIYGGAAWRLTEDNNCNFLAIDPNTGVVTGTPNNQDVGQCNLVTIYNDGQDDSNSKVILLSISNSDPTLNISDLTIAEDAVSAVIKSDASIESSDEDQRTPKQKGYYAFTAPFVSPDCRSVGSASIEERNGELTYAPNSNFSGVCQFRIAFHDDHGRSIEDEFTLTVSSSNDAPIISTADCSNTTLTQGEDFACELTMTDPDDDAIVSRTATGCTWITIAANGEVTGTPTDDDVGSCSLEMYVTDSNASNSNTLGAYNITVNNIAPELEAFIATLPEAAGSRVVFSDAEIQASEEGYGTYSTIAQTIGTDCSSVGLINIDTNNGEITFDSTDDNYFGTCYVGVQFSDGNIASDNHLSSAVMKLIITNVPDAPTLSYNTGACGTTLNEDVVYSCAATYEDPDLDFEDDELSFTKAGSDTCSWLELSEKTGMLYGIPKDADVGVCTVDINLTDSSSTTVNYSYAITVNNVAPTLNVDRAFIIDGTSANTIVKQDIQVQASDEGSGANYLSIAATSGPDCTSLGSVVINSNTGQVTFDPTTTISTNCYINMRFTDNNAATVEGQFQLYVQAIDTPPVLSATCPTSIDQDNAYSCSSGPSATDDEASSITFQTGPAHSCNWLTLNPTTGELSGTPIDENVGSCTLDIRAFDGAFFSASYNINVAVDNVAPTLAVSDISFDEDDAELNTLLTDANVQSSEEGHGLYSLITAGLPTTGCHEAALLNINSSSGEVTWSYPANFSGSCLIRIQFDDQNTLSSTVTDDVTLTINPINDAPILTDLSSTCSTSPVQGQQYNCKPTLSDPDNDAITWSTGASHTCAWAQISAGSGEITGSPADNQVGSCNIHIIATDDADTPASSEQVLSLSVQNGAPTLSLTGPLNIEKGSGSITLLEDYQVQANEEGEGLYSITNAVSGFSCDDVSVATSISIDATSGEVTFNPDDNFEGTCNLGIVFDDQNSLSNSRVTAIISVLVTDEIDNLGPIITKNIRPTVLQGTTNFIINEEYLAARDFDNTNGQIIFELLSLPKTGTLAKSGSSISIGDTFTKADILANAFTFTQNDIYADFDLFRFKVSDTDGNTSSTKTFFMTIQDKRAAFDAMNVVFANNGESLFDLSSSLNKTITETGYQGTRILSDQTSAPIYGGYLDFPDTSSNFHLVADLSTDASFNTSDFSIEFYIKTTVATESVIMATQNYAFAAPAGDNLAGWGLKINGDGTVNFSTHNNTDNLVFDSSQVINDGNWHNISITRSTNLQMFVNGVAQGSALFAGGFDVIAEDNLIIGSRNIPGELLNGIDKIDEIKIYRTENIHNQNYLAFTCPPNFIMAPANSYAGESNPFCVAKYEMKESDPATPISTPLGIVWDDVTQSEAKTLCNNMGDGFNLITNSKWMALSYDIEQTSNNWENGVFNQYTNTDTKLSRGNAFDSTNSLAASAVDAEFCHLLTECSEFGSWDKKKRTMSLSNGNIIWDLSGNTAEHVDSITSTDKPAAGTADDAYFDVNDSIATTTFPKNSYRPLSLFLNNQTMTTEDHNMGTYFPGNNGSGGYMLRGGDSTPLATDPTSGIYFLDLRNGSGQLAGFRCTFQ